MDSPLLETWQRLCETQQEKEPDFKLQVQKVYDDINDYIASGGEMKPGGIVPVRNINVPIKPLEPAFNLHVPCELCGHQVSFLFNGSCEDCIQKYKPKDFHHVR